MTSLVARTSSSPSGEPCALLVFCLLGDGQPMIDRTRISDGRSSSRIALSTATSSALRSLASSTIWTCQR